jgi:hypothetical protein
VSTRKENKLARNFRLEDYETVEDRLERALATYKDLRVVTVNHTTADDRANRTWVVEARVYMNVGDQAADLPKATGWAFEVDGTGMANQTSALENCETSALGRALKQAFGGSRGPSRQEMEKVQRGATPRDWVGEADKLEQVDQLRLLWAQAKQSGADKATLIKLEARANDLGSRGLST